MSSNVRMTSIRGSVFHPFKSRHISIDSDDSCKEELEFGGCKTRNEHSIRSKLATFMGDAPYNGETSNQKKTNREAARETNLVHYFKVHEDSDPEPSPSGSSESSLSNSDEFTDSDYSAGGKRQRTKS